MPAPFAASSKSLPYLIVVSDDEARSLAERRGVSHLLGHPGRTRLARHGEVNDLPRSELDDEEREDGSEPDVVDLQKVAGPGLMGSAPPEDVLHGHAANQLDGFHRDARLT